MQNNFEIGMQNNTLYFYCCSSDLDIYGTWHVTVDILNNTSSMGDKTVAQ